MIDILYLAKGRPEFTTASLRTLLRNTDWRTARLNIYTDGDPDTYVRSIVSTRRWPLDCANCINTKPLGGPVEIMLDFLKVVRSNVFAKIDGDCIVPPEWLERGLDIMQGFPELDLLGLEPNISRTPNPQRAGISPPLSASPESKYINRFGYGSSYAPCDSIGGIGLMRKKVFDIYPDMKSHSIYGGFSDWQLRHPAVIKGWIIPPIKLFLLDRLNFSPWKELSAKYIASGQQRAWTMYPPTSSSLWQWWLEEWLEEANRTHEAKR